MSFRQKRTSSNLQQQQQQQQLFKPVNTMAGGN